MILVMFLKLSRRRYVGFSGALLIRALLTRGILDSGMCDLSQNGDDGSSMIISADFRAGGEGEF